MKTYLIGSTIGLLLTLGSILNLALYQDAAIITMIMCLSGGLIFVLSAWIEEVRTITC